MDMENQGNNSQLEGNVNLGSGGNQNVQNYASAIS
jgi:hypothetical protein